MGARRAGTRGGYHRRRPHRLPLGPLPGDQETDMSEEDLERYETDVELQIYQEYRDVLPMFRYVVETERRFYLANKVDLHTRDTGAGVFFEVDMEDAWVWDMYRPPPLLKRGGGVH